MSKLKIGLDIDQVLADFINPYYERFGQPKTDLEITRNVQRKLRKDKKFWTSLPLINVPNFDVTLYCTKRVNPKSYTKQWLKEHNCPDAPVYQMYYQHGNKADMIKGKVDVFVDDSISNFIALNLSGVPCLLMDSESNQEWGSIGRIYSLDYAEIEETYQQFTQEHFENFETLLQ